MDGIQVDVSAMGPRVHRYPLPSELKFPQHRLLISPYLEEWRKDLRQ